MVLTFYVGAAAVEFKQYAAYVQRRTATRAAQLLAANRKYLFPVGIAARGESTCY